MTRIARSVLVSGLYVNLAWTAGLQDKGRCRIAPGNVIRASDIHACRPDPVSQAHRAAMLRSLPANGEVAEHDTARRLKLESLEPVLQLHRREGVYEIKVIDVPQAWTGLHGRAVLLISLPALQLLDAEELQALVAHEIGHEYLWEEYEMAQIRHDVQRLRKLETACDTIAVQTLNLLGVKPERLISGLEKVFRFNRNRFGIAQNEDSYPSLKERRGLIRRLTARK